MFADFDNDGNKDLFISSGIVKRPVDLDFIRFVSDMKKAQGMDATDKYDDETIAAMPDGDSHPFFFKGDGNMSFKDVSDDWGTQKLKGFSNGASYADLDNDGNLDLVSELPECTCTHFKKQFAKEKFYFSFISKVTVLIQWVLAVKLIFYRCKNAIPAIDGGKRFYVFVNLSIAFWIRFNKSC